MKDNKQIRQYEINALAYFFMALFCLVYQIYENNLVLAFIGIIFLNMGFYLANQIDVEELKLKIGDVK